MRLKALNLAGIRQIFQLGIVVVLFLAAVPLFSAGRADPLLSRADGLVKEKRYNEALRILTEFIREDDIRFDSAQYRIREILKKFDDYNHLVNELVNVIEQTPEDYETIVFLADKLRELDAPRDEETRLFVNHIQELARFTINRRRIEEILREGRALIEAGNYVAALRKYQTGFDIYRAEFFEARFSTDVEEKTRTILTAIEQAIIAVDGSTKQLNDIRESVRDMSNHENTNQNRRVLNNALTALNTGLDRLVSAKESFSDAQHFFEATGNKPEVDKSGKAGRHFFAAAALFLRGRTGDRLPREGMVGAVEELWKSVVFPVTVAYADIAEQLYQAARIPTENADYPRARTNIAAAKNFLEPARILSEKSKSFVDIDARQTETVTPIMETMLKFTLMNKALDYFSSAEDIGVRFIGLQNRAKTFNLSAWQDLRVPAEQLFTEINAIRGSYDSLNTQVAANLNAINEDTAALKKAPLPKRSLTEDGETPLESGLRYCADSRRVMEKLGGAIENDELAQTDKFYTVVHDTLKKRIENLEKSYAEGTRLLDGFEITTEQGQQVSAKYSREAGNVFHGMEDALSSGINIAELTLDALKYESNRGDNFAGQLRAYDNDITEYTQKLRELAANEERDNLTAQERAGRAESLRIDGERTLAETRRVLENGEFDLARERLEQTTERFIESLNLQENPALRRRWVEQIDPLAEEIARIEYEYIVREVRDLINTSRDRYYAGVFDRAEEALMRAESRWKRIRAEPNEEVTYWLGIIRNALSLRSGSNVPITAPQYPEISQLLSEAKKKYNDGVTLIGKNRREEGVIKFAQAKEKTQEVKLMFPVNQDAGILELRIDQEIDPGSFEASFRQRFVTAVAGTKRGSREAYFELENLAQINPSYTGMQAALTEAKYDIGLLQRPVDTSTSNRAASMVTQARRLFSQGTTRNAEVIRLASEALALNPNNTQAMELLDRARLRVTAARGTVISDQAAEQEYLLAVQEFQQGRTLNALARMQRLLRNPGNQNNIRFNELLRRINALL